MRRALATVLGVFAVAAVLPSAGCRDEVVSPTMGFLSVETGGVQEVSVFLDGEPAGQAPGSIGPLPAGEYSVRVEKKYYEVAPAARSVTVRPAETASVSFDLTLVVSGEASLSAVDELDGTPVTGASIWIDDGPAGLTDTGQTTPAVVAGLAPGPTRFVLRKAGFEDTPPFVVDVPELDAVAASAEMGPLHGVLAEMTTYTLCVNCIPAVDSLQALHEDYPEDFYVIEWHVRSGLDLYDDRWSERKIYYGAGNLGDPSLIVQGDGENLVNAGIPDPYPYNSLSDYRVQVEAARDACGGDCPVTMRTHGTIHAGSADITARIKARTAGLPGSLQLRWVLLEDDPPARGVDPDGYFDVARDYLEQAVVLAPGQVLEQSVSFSLDPGWDPENLHWVVFLQSDATQEILAVHGGR